MVDFGDIGIYSLAVNLGGQLWLIPDAFKDVLFNKKMLERMMLKPSLWLLSLT